MNNETVESTKPFFRLQQRRRVGVILCEGRLERLQGQPFAFLGGLMASLGTLLAHFQLVFCAFVTAVHADVNAEFTGVLRKP